MERLSDHERTQRHPVHRHQRERLQLGWHLRQRPAESNPGLTLSTAHGTRAEQVAEWFNTAAFCDNNGGTNVACPSGVVGIGPNGQDGSSGRNSLRGPRFYQPDLGLFRDLHISERLACRHEQERQTFSISSTWIIQGRCSDRRHSESSAPRQATAPATCESCNWAFG